MHTNANCDPLNGVRVCARVLVAQQIHSRSGLVQGNDCVRKPHAVTHTEREMSEHLNTSVCCVLHSTGVCLNRSDFSRVKKTTHGSSV